MTPKSERQSHSRSYFRTEGRSYVGSASYIARFEEADELVERAMSRLDQITKHLDTEPRNHFFDELRHRLAR